MNYCYKFKTMKKIFLLFILFCSFFSQVLAQELTESNYSSVGKSTGSNSIELTENKITIDAKNMDILDILNIFTQRAGMNIVVGKYVAGKVTLFLKDVDIWDAFELILSSNELAYEIKGKIINVMTQRDYELLYGERYKDKKQPKIIKLNYAKAADVANSLSQMKSEAGRVVANEGANTIALIDIPMKVAIMEDFINSVDLALETRIYVLNYAQADKVAAKIQEELTKGIGSIRIDERTNKIAVTDRVDRLELFDKIVNAFDEKTQQVLIDAQVVQVTPTNLFEMGVDWNYWIEKYFQVKAALPLAASGNSFFIGTPSTNPTEKGQYKGIIDILKTVGDTKVLSSPRIMALNNQEAKIHVGTREAYITSSTSQSTSGPSVTSQSVNFVDTGIKLYVTPTINREGFVTMKIKPEISDATKETLISQDQETDVPIVTSSEAETTVMVKDGVSIIIGGLSKDEKRKTVKKIPLLGDLPIIGAAFRSTSDNNRKTELVIILTPHIISGEESITSAIKPTNGIVYNMKKGKISSEEFGSVQSEENKKYDINNYPGDKKEYYYQVVVDKVKEAAKNIPTDNLKGKVIISFTLDKQGRISGEPNYLGSTNYSLITLAKQAVREASPFPAFPQELPKKEENFLVELEY